MSCFSGAAKAVDNEREAGALVIQGQENLEKIVGTENGNAELANLFKENMCIIAVTKDEKWVDNIFLPKAADVPPGCKFQLNCESLFDAHVSYKKYVGDTTMT